MKKHLSLILGILFFSLGCYAQNTTVSATVTDGDSVVWSNATWSIDFVPGIQFPAPSQYTINGAALSSAVTHQTGTLSNAGALSVVVYDSSIVTPTGSGWRLNICPLTSGNCVTYQFATAGGSQSISTNLTTLIGQPRFNCLTNCYGYSPVQAIGKTGSIFTYSLSGGTATYNGTNWLSNAITLCKLATPFILTGTLTTTNAFSCTIPPGALNNASRLELKVFTRTSAGNVANSTLTIRYGLNNTSGDSGVVQDPSVGASVNAIGYTTLQESNAINSQQVGGYIIRNSTIGGGAFSFAATNSSNVNQYLSFWITLGNVADTATVIEADVVFWP